MTRTTELALHRHAHKRGFDVLASRGDPTGKSSLGCVLVACRECGAVRTTSVRQIPKLSCVHPLVDDHTPYEDDTVCQLLVAEGPQTLAEIGEVMGGISRERVRQLLDGALRTLRESGEMEAFRECLEI